MHGTAHNGRYFLAKAPKLWPLKQRVDRTFMTVKDKHEVISIVDIIRCPEVPFHAETLLFIFAVSFTIESAFENFTDNGQYSHQDQNLEV